MPESQAKSGTTSLLTPPLLNVERDNIRTTIEKYEEAEKSLAVAEGVVQAAKDNVVQRQREESEAAEVLVTVLESCKLRRVVYNGREYSRVAQKGSLMDLADRLLVDPCDILFLGDGVIMDEEEQVEHGRCHKPL